MSVQLIKVPTRKKSGNLFNDPRIYTNKNVSQEMRRIKFSVNLRYKRAN